MDLLNRMICYCMVSRGYIGHKINTQWVLKEKRKITEVLCSELLADFQALFHLSRGVGNYIGIGICDCSVHVPANIQQGSTEWHSSLALPVSQL